MSLRGRFPRSKPLFDEVFPVKRGLPRRHTCPAVSHRRPQDRSADARGIPAAVAGSARESGVDRTVAGQGKTRQNSY